MYLLPLTLGDFESKFRRTNVWYEIAINYVHKTTRY